MFILKDKRHPTLVRDGDNLIIRPEISLLQVVALLVAQNIQHKSIVLFIYIQALCGGNVNVHTLDDRILTIPITEVIRYSLTLHPH